MNNKLDGELVKRRTRWIKYIFVFTFLYIIFLIVGSMVTISVFTGTYSHPINKVGNHDVTLFYFLRDKDLHPTTGGYKFNLILAAGMFGVLFIDWLLTRLVYVQFNKYYKSLNQSDKQVLINWNLKRKLAKINRKKDALNV